MQDEYEMIQDAVKYIRAHWSKQAQVGIILGTGLGNLATSIEADLIIDYSDIPHFPRSTVEIHAGKLILGTFEGKTVIAMQGRFHFYEGYSMKQITFPVRVMKELGIETLIVSNACGGLNPQFRAGDIMLIEDHINLLGDNPLIGVNDERLGPRWPDMIEPYSKKLIALAEQTALENELRVQTGVYVAVAGPNLETRAEYRFLRTIGADVVGMSTVPEVIVAVHAGIKVLGFSIITDMGLPDALESVQIQRILDVAAAAEPKMNLIIKNIIRKL